MRVFPAGSVSHLAGRGPAIIRATKKSGTGTDPAATAFFVAASTAGGPVSTPRKTIYNNLFTSLRSSTWLARLDRLGLPGAESQAQGLVDLITLQTYPVTGTMTFAANLGLTGDAAGGLIDTGFIPSSAGGHFTLNKAMFGVAITSTRSAGQTWCALGTSSVDPGESRIYPWYADNNQYFSNNAQFSGGTASPAAVHGIYMSNRPDSGHIVSYRNTTVIKNDAVAANSLDNISFLVAATHAGAGASADWSGDTIAGFWIGDGATGDADQAVLQGILNTYFTAIGAL